MRTWLQWVFGIPVIYYTTITLGHGLPATWFWINVPYAGMNACLLVMFAITDWHAVQAAIHDSHSEKKDIEEGDEVVIQTSSDLARPSIHGKSTATSTCTETTSLLPHQPQPDVP